MFKERGYRFVFVVNWILVKCENVWLPKKMIGSGSQGGKLAIRANPLVRQSALAQSKASVAPCQPTVLGEGGERGPQGKAKQALGGLRVQHGEPGQPKDGGESGEGLDDGEGEEAGRWEAKAAQGLLLLLLSRVGKSTKNLLGP